MAAEWKRIWTRFILVLNRVTPENMIRNSSMIVMRNTMEMPESLTRIS